MKCSHDFKTPDYQGHNRHAINVRIILKINQLSIMSIARASRLIFINYFNSLLCGVNLSECSEPVCVYASLCLSGRVLMETVSFFSFWSRVLHAVINTEWCPTVGLLRKQASVTNSKLQSIPVLFPFMEVIHTLPQILIASLSLVTLVSVAHSIEEKSETQGDQRTCLSWRLQCATCFLHKFGELETEK